MLGLP